MKAIVNKSIKIYKGYYNNHLIAISLNRELLEIYFEVNRKTESYTIEKDYITTSELISEYYDNILMDEFYNTYLPKIDILMIEFYENNIAHLPNEALLSLINLMTLLNDNKYEKEMKILLDASVLCHKISNDNKLKFKLQEKAYKNSPIAYMEIDKYLQQRKSFLQLYEGKQKWDNGYYD